MQWNQVNRLLISCRQPHTINGYDSQGSEISNIEPWLEYVNLASLSNISLSNNVDPVTSSQ